MARKPVKKTKKNTPARKESTARKNKKTRRIQYFRHWDPDTQAWVADEEDERKKEEKEKNSKNKYEDVEFDVETGSIKPKKKIQVLPKKDTFEPDVGNPKQKKKNWLTKKIDSFELEQAKKRGEKRRQKEKQRKEEEKEQKPLQEAAANLIKDVDTRTEEEKRKGFNINPNTGRPFEEKPPEQPQTKKEGIRLFKSRQKKYAEQQKKQEEQKRNQEKQNEKKNKGGILNKIGLGKKKEFQNINPNTGRPYEKEPPQPLPGRKPVLTPEQQQQNRDLKNAEQERQEAALRAEKEQKRLEKERKRQNREAEKEQKRQKREKNTGSIGEKVSGFFKRQDAQNDTDEVEVYDPAIGAKRKIPKNQTAEHHSTNYYKNGADNRGKPEKRSKLRQVGGKAIGALKNTGKKISETKLKKGVYNRTLVPLGHATAVALGESRNVIYYDVGKSIFYDRFGVPLKGATTKFRKNGEIRAKISRKINEAQQKTDAELLQLMGDVKEEHKAKKGKKKRELVETRAAEGKTGWLARHNPLGKTTKEYKDSSQKLHTLRTKGAVHYKDYTRKDALLGRKILYKGQTLGKTAEGKLNLSPLRSAARNLESSVKNKNPSKMTTSERKKYRKDVAELKQINRILSIQEKKGLVTRTGSGVKRFIRKRTYGAEGRKAWLRRAEGLTNYGSRNLERTFSGIGRLGEAVSTGASKSISPIQIFQMAWGRLSVTLKALVLTVIFAAVLFIPWGIFYYTGWAIAAAFMFLMSLVYWLMISVLNGVGYVAVTIVNGIVSIIMRIVIAIVETIFGFLTDKTQLIVPQERWAANYDGDPWSAPDFLKEAEEFRHGDITMGSVAQVVQGSYWWEGHMLLHGSLIAYDQIANVPSLMLVSAPEWQDWMYTTVIVRAIELLGLNTIAELFKNVFSSGISNAFNSFISFAPPWLVVIVGLAPAIIIGVAIFLWYRKIKDKIQTGQSQLM